MTTIQTTIARGAALFTLLLALTLPLAAEAGGEGGLPSLGIGTYGNLGYGTNSFSAVPGLSLLVGNFPLALHLGYSDKVLSLAGSLDWLALNVPLGESVFSWYAGPGIYGSYAKAGDSSGFSGWGAGLRADIGVRAMILGRVEAYASVLPAFGCGFIGDKQSWLWNADLELGLRYTLKMDGSGKGDRGKAASAVAYSMPEVVLKSAPAFDPSGEPSTLAISVSVSDPASVASWKLELIDLAGKTAKRMTGAGPLPPEFSWDGRNPGGKVVEGSYSGILSFSTKEGRVGKAKLAPFVLSTKAPSLATAFPADFRYTPDGNGSEDNLELKVSIASDCPIADWSMAISDPVGNPFKTLGGPGTPPYPILWDGRSELGEFVASEQNYEYSFKINDILGRSAEARGSIAVGINLIKSGEDYKLDLAGLVFLPNKAELVMDSSQAGARNAEILARLQKVLGQLGEYDIDIVGHAVNVSGTQDEEAELMVLSTARARTVRDFLIQLGIDPARISTAGKGGTEPIVPHGDKANNWKNRRVEFILTRHAGGSK